MVCIKKGRLSGDECRISQEYGSKGIIKCICELIHNKGLSAGNVSTRYVEELMRVRKFNSFGKIQGGHAHF